MAFILRALLLAAAAAILPSCHLHWNDRVHVTVHNDGAVSADIHSRAEYWSGFTWDDHLDVSVSPHESVEFRVRYDDLTRLEIHIYRSSDHFKLFDSDWDRQDLDDLDLHVRITVNP